MSSSVAQIDEKFADGDEIVLRGTITRITFSNDSNGFTVFRLEPDAEVEELAGQTTTVIGTLNSGIGSGANVRIRGQWQTHQRFGKQIRAFSVTEEQPTTAAGIERYLASGSVKGIGPATAKQIVARFGEDTLKILDEAPDELLQISGIGPSKLREITSQWDVKRTARELEYFLTTHGLPLSLGARLEKVYKNRVIEVLRENPYLLSKEIRGIGFQTADRIAQALGMPLDAPARIRAGLAQTLSSGTDDGHVYLPHHELVGRTMKLLQIGDEDKIQDELTHQIQSAELIRRDEKVYLHQLDTAEGQIARLIARRSTAGQAHVKPIDDDAITAWTERSLTTPAGTVVKLSGEQQHAVKLAAEQSLLVITGGPGCGKTTLVRAIVGMYRQSGLEIRLASPTGRAAQRLAEVCEAEASTIHRLLKFDPHRRQFVHDEHNPIEADALIVDESSMIDVPLAHALLRALAPKTRLVIIGDADQLPSVGPGLFLADLLAIESVARVKLTTLFRRADESSITQIAHKINSGAIPNIPQPDGFTKSDAYFLKTDTAADAANLIERLVSKEIPEKFSIPNKDITVLSPMNRGELGIVALNQRLQEKLVQRMPGTPSVKVGNIEFRFGDRVCQRVNNYNLDTTGVFNGDQGTVIGIDKEARTLHVKLWDGREIEYPRDSINELDLAYALTVHRAQGSEVPAVVLALHDSHTILLERQLIYTAITRAKKLLIIVGTRKALIVSCKRMRSKRRYSALPERVTDALDTITEEFDA